MNLFLKYTPIVYTFNTRLKTLITKLYYFWTDLGTFVIAIVYLWISDGDQLISLAQNIFLLIYIYIIYMIFYEIWYIHNDCFAVEKNKTKRIIDTCSKKFWFYQILFRTILWLWLLLPLNHLSHYWFLLMIFNIAIMEFVFLIHNIIRNYSINIFSRLLLRLCKLFLFIVLLVFIKKENLIMEFSPIIIMVLLFHFLDLFASRHSSYNEKLWWKNMLKYWYTYIFIMIIFLFLWVVFQSLVFCLPLIILIPKIIYFLISNKSAFSIKNDR